jgi:hypothetical protein
MDTGQFWELIAGARAQVADPADSETVAAQAAALLSASSREEIVAAQRALSGLMAASYRHTLWAAASLINGGCGDDGFEYFRGWLVTQGRAVFERSVADPDTLADLPGMGPPRPGRLWTECEETLYIAMRAHNAATGQELPADAFTMRYPEPEGWDFDFADRAKMEWWLPRLTALCWPM